MAEKTINAEPGASAGKPGRGRVDTDVSLNPRKRLVTGIRTNSSKKIPHSRLLQID
jgi:hypothetical protein